MPINFRASEIGAVPTTILEKNEKFGRSLFLGLFLLALVFVLAGCQGFMDDYNYNPVAALPGSSNP